MALVAADIQHFPALPMLMSAGGTISQTFDAATDMLAFVGPVPRDGTISNVHYRIDSVSSPIMTLRMELRTVDAATGLPNAAGTLYGSSTSITESSITTGNKTAAVNATAAAAGDLVAIVMDLSAFTSGSFAASNRQIALGEPISTSVVSVYPYGVQNLSGSPTLTDRVPMGFALEYDGVGLVPMVGYYQWIGTGGTATVTNSGTTRRGNTFTPTTPRRAIGMYAHLQYSGAGAAVMRLRLASDDSVLATCTLDKDVRGVASHAYGRYLFDNGDTVNLAAGTEYYMTLEGTDATGFTIYYLLNGPTGCAALMPGGANCYGITYNGSYTEAATTRYEIGLLTDQEDDGSGGSGGGLLTHPGMAGGMRG